MANNSSVRIRTKTRFKLVLGPETEPWEHAAVPLVAQSLVEPRIHTLKPRRNNTRGNHIALCLWISGKIAP